VRLLYVIDSVVAAGAERSLVALTTQYVRKGHEVEVVYLHDRPGLQPELTAAGASLTCVDGPGGRAGWLARVTARARRSRPDLVHTTLFEADVVGRVAARLAGVPVVSTLAAETYGPSHLSDPDLRRWKVRSTQAVDAATARLTRRLHAVATSVADEMSVRLHYPRDRIDVVTRGRDPSELGRRTPDRRAAARRALGVTDEARVLLAVARHEHQKGLDVLLAALPAIRSQVPQARLVVAGRTGNQTAMLEAYIADHDLGRSVTFLGARDDVSDLLAGADLFVFPSRREGSPGALIEAMALELPAVVSDIPQNREVADERSARFVPVEAPDPLAAAVVELLDEPARAAELARNARAVFESRFQIGAVADRMVAFYERALGTGHG
jgi:glycosyltransferase involved in cell wall biosynthesis